MHIPSYFCHRTITKKCYLKTNSEFRLYTKIEKSAFRYIISINDGVLAVLLQISAEMLHVI